MTMGMTEETRAVLEGHGIVKHPTTPRIEASLKAINERKGGLRLVVPEPIAVQGADGGWSLPVARAAVQMEGGVYEAQAPDPALAVAEALAQAIAAGDDRQLGLFGENPATNHGDTP